jgi:hypothetical protein
MDIRTCDLYFASALVALGREIVQTKRDGGRFYWVFAGGDLEQVQSQWANDSLVVKARSYSSAIRVMKSMVHGQIKEEQ